jgi:hypothetical protein
MCRRHVVGRDVVELIALLPERPTWSRLKTIEYQSAIAPQTKVKQLYLVGKQFGKSWTGSFAFKIFLSTGTFVCK